MNSGTAPIRTRFAPSPTGFLHIGGVRTALFNWLLARQTGGQFILRIDDTDANRNQEQALQPILDGFRWLGLDWDEGPEVGGPHGPYFQSERGDRYQAAVDQLLNSGAAYRDFATADEMQAERAAAENAKQNFVYSRRWMAETAEQAASWTAEGRQSVVRLKMPREGDCTFNDHVRGEVRVAWNQEADHVIQRADGSFIYHLANVVDDQDFEITHVVRAVEHLSNTPRQLFMIDALDYRRPEYAHIPFVAEPGSQNKLSKRKIAKYLKNPDFRKLYEHGMGIAAQLGISEDPDAFSPVLVEFYQQVGYLPQSLLNYLLLLGWSLDGQTEDFDTAAMLQHFSLERVVKNPASFDPQKLLAFQERKMQQLPVEQRAQMAGQFLVAAGVLQTGQLSELQHQIERLIEFAGDRIKVAGDVLEFSGFFQADEELEMDDAAFEKRVVQPESATHLLAELLKRLTVQQEFTAEALESTVKEFIETQGIKFGDIIHALRLAVTGKPSGFGMFESMELLGPASCCRRIELAMEQAHALRSST